MSEDKNINQTEKYSLFGRFAWAFVFVLLVFNLGTFFFKYNSFGMNGNVVGTYASPPIFTTDMIIFIAQWIVLIALVLFLYLRHARRTRGEQANINIPQFEKFKNVKGGTDIDVLYSVLQENKEVGLSTVEKLFKITAEQALKWCKVLEEHNLATISYPAFSEPIIKKA